MANKKIRKKGEPRLGELPKSKPAPKSGKRGCLFWLLLFLLIAVGGVYQRDLIKPYFPHVTQAEAQVLSWVSGWFGGGPDSNPVLPDESIEAITPALLEVEPLPKKNKKLKTRRVVKTEYVRVGNCLTVECRVQLVKEIELLGLPSMVKQVTKRTVYYELVSKKLYTRSSGESKIVDLERHALAAPTAALRARGTRWQVSLGEFPQKRQAVYMKSYLSQLYPDVDLPLRLRPRRRSLTAQYIFAGPFSSKFNANQVVGLLEDRRFIQETVVVSKP